MTGTRIALLLALGTLAFPALAQQAPPRDPIAAEALFERGKQLIDQGHTAEACAAFEESQRLDPAGGTLLRLALCREAEGKLASAWLGFTEVVRMSKEAAGEPAKLQERIRLAREHLAAIEPRVPRLAITVSAGGRVDGLAVSANGSPRNEGTWGVALPVDPGDVVVSATAPGKREFRTTVHVAEGQQQSVEIPALQPLAPVATAAAPPSPVVAASAPGGAHASFLRPTGIALGVLGLAAVGVGAYFGAHAISQWNASNAACPGSTCTDSAGVSLASDAKNAARIADVTLAAGAAALVAGVVLYLVGAPAPVPAATGAAAGPFPLISF